MSVAEGSNTHLRVMEIMELSLPTQQLNGGRRIDNLTQAKATLIVLCISSEQYSLHDLFQFRETSQS